MREIKYYAMDIHQIRRAMNYLIHEQMYLEEDSLEYVENYKEQDVCMMILDQKEIEILQHTMMRR